MSAIKECKRCGKNVPHHSELDNICMQCEMEKYYPNDPDAAFNIGLLESCAYSLDAITEARQELADITSRVSANPFKGILSRIFK